MCNQIYIPFGRVALLLYLREDAFRFVVDAVGALWHFAIAFDLFLPTHIARLSPLESISVYLGMIHPHPRDPPPLRITGLVPRAQCRIIVHGPGSTLHLGIVIVVQLWCLVHHGGIHLEAQVVVPHIHFASEGQRELRGVEAMAVLGNVTAGCLGVLDDFEKL
jgi:hypothetical protein